MVWDDETIGLLKGLWSQGLSTAEIGRRLGVSKNAIVGKAHRLELDARPSPIRRESRPASERPVALPRMAGPTLPPLTSTDVQTVAPPLPRPTNVQPLRALHVAPPRPSTPTPVLAVAPRPGAIGRTDPGAPLRPFVLLADRRTGHQELPVLR